ncbi:MAG: phosphoribosylanthranilate isomerase [Thermostichales cyanobacterium BF4_bins_65]
MWLKICGLTQGAQALKIAEMGASALGVIAVPQSPRYCSPEQILHINQCLQAAGVGIPLVAVMMDPAWELLEVLLGRVGGVQLHGQESPQLCEQIRSRYPEVLLIKALRPRTEADLAAAAAYAPWVDYVLIDAYHPHLAGGTGQTGNWQLLTSWDPPCPWLLAGGLNARTLPQALAQVRPDGVDLSSGVEDAPGIKNLQRVAEIMEILRC